MTGIDWHALIHTWRSSRPWSSMQRPSVPSLFRQTPISTTKRDEPTRSEIPAQRHVCRYRYRHQEFELYSDR
jgi:hypothetical protein